MDDQRQLNDGCGETGCDEVAAALDRFVEGELDSTHGLRVESHLAECDACRDLVDEMRAERLWILERAVQAPQLPESFAARVTEKLRAELAGEQHDAGQDGDAEQDGADRREPERISTIILSNLRPWTSAAAALIAISAVAFWLPRLADGPTVAHRSTVRSPSASLSELAVSPALAATAPGTITAFALPLNETSHTEAAFPRTCSAATSIDTYCPAIDEPDVTTLVAVTMETPTAPVHATASTPERSGRVRRALFRSSRNLGAMYSLASRVVPNGAPEAPRHAAYGAPPYPGEEPCAEDLNDDGQTDVADVALGLYVIWNSGLPEACDAAPPYGDDLLCKDPCLY